MSELHRGDVVLVAFPFVRAAAAERKVRPAVVVQAERYNRRRAAVILVAVTTARAHRELPCKVAISRDSREGRQGGLRVDSVVDCQTIVTVPREEVIHRLGTFPPAVMERIDRALHDALGLPPGD